MHHRRRHLAVAIAVAVACGWPVSAQLTPVPETVDLDAVYRIKEEGLQRSEVMEIESYLTDVYGPRLTGSPNYSKAADYAQRKFEEWGLVNIHRETWPFGRGWSNERFVALAVSPQPYPLIGYPKAWTPGTQGTVTAEATLATIQSEKDFEKYRGQLRGKFVLTMPLADVKAQFDPPGHRYTETELTDLAKQPDPLRAAAQNARRPSREEQELAKKRLQFFLDEGVAAVIEAGRGSGGTVFVGSGGSRDGKDPPVPPQVVLSVEHYNRIARTLEKKIPVTLEIQIQNKFHEGDLSSFNVLAEIPGTDKADEVVMLGAHFDSWHSGTGATDNAAGSAVMMEAMRILKVAGLKPRRTVRIALWGGEEQGLLGSKAYVKDHFADRDTMQVKPEHAKLAGYFNVDNGTGAIRGVYLQGNEAVAPILTAWMEPFKNLGMTTLAIRNTGGTDHLSFDAVGLPGFQFVQDPVEYDTRTHHSNMDVYDRIQAADMMQNAVIVASFVYETANRDQKLPRKPLPRAQPPVRTTTPEGGK
jgi:hypothetical protein